jgi:activator of HSP90 ATPase
MKIREIVQAQQTVTTEAQDIRLKTLKHKSSEIDQQDKNVSPQQQLAKSQQKLAKTTSTATTAPPTE